MLSYKADEIMCIMVVKAVAFLLMQNTHFLNSDFAQINQEVKPADPTPKADWVDY